MINSEAEYNQMLSDNNEYQYDNQREMSELEKYIYDHVIERLPNMVEDLKNHKYDGFVQYPFYLDGCINSVLFNLQDKVAKPIHIEYRYGIGEGEYQLGGSTAAFNDFEIRQIYFEK